MKWGTNFRGTSKVTLNGADVLASSSGYVRPPSRLRRRFTRAQLTGATFVLATAQVTVWVVPPAQLTAVLGAVTTKGPAVEVTFRLTKALETMPPTTPAAPLWTSRTVQRNLSVRATLGRRSPGASVLATSSFRRGK